jgi:hypothetical protein
MNESEVIRKSQSKEQSLYSSSNGGNSSETPLFSSKQQTGNDNSMLIYYFFVMNVISLGAFILLSFLMISTQFILYFKSVIFVFSCIHLLSLLVSVKWLLYSKSMSKNERRLIQLIQYARELPLATIAFYLFTQFYVKQLNSNLEINYYFTFILFIYLSSSGLFTCIIIETNENQKKEKLLFKFIFRFFCLMSRWPGFVLVFSTLINKIHNNHLIIIATTLFIFIFFIHFLWSLVIYSSRRINGWIILFHTIRGFIDFNEDLIVLKRKCFTVIASLVFITFQLFSQIIGGYFWYYRALILPVIKYSEASFYLNQIKSSHQIEPSYFVKLEAEITFKQICLISIVGSIVLTFLSAFIYYSYYYNNNINNHKNDKLETIKYSDNYHFNNDLIVKNDLSLNDSQSSGSISTIFNINEYKLNSNIPHHKSTSSLKDSAHDEEEVILPK